MEIHGHQVRIAHNGFEAEAVAGEFLPDIVLLDIGMPAMSGYEVAQYIRATVGPGNGARGGDGLGTGG